MLELIGKLKDLKSLIGVEYYDDLKSVVLALLAGDWKAATGLLFDLAKAVVIDRVFGDTAGILENFDAVTPAAENAEEVAETELNAAFDELSKQTVTASVGTWLTIIVTVIDLIKKFKQS